MENKILMPNDFVLTIYGYIDAREVPELAERIRAGTTYETVESSCECCDDYKMPVFTDDAQAALDEVTEIVRVRGGY